MARVKDIEAKGPYYVCGGCGLLFRMEFFYKADCRWCHVKRSKKWIAANYERFLEHNRLSYRRHAEDRLARGHQWALENHERVREIQRRSEAKRTPEEIREKQARRRALKRHVGAERIDLAAIWERDEGICHLCGDLVDRSDVHFDHVIPLARGGSHTAENVKVSHARCNLRKGARVQSLSA